MLLRWGVVPSRAFRFAAVAGPALAAIVGLPLALLPFEALRGDPRGFFGPYFLLAVPVWLALFAAPGYLACIYGGRGARESSLPRRWWIRASLLVATLASGAALWGATLMVLFGPPALVTLICAVVLWWRFEAAHARPVS